MYDRAVYLGTVERNSALSTVAVLPADDACTEVVSAMSRNKSFVALLWRALVLSVLIFSLASTGTAQASLSTAQHSNASRSLAEQLTLQLADLHGQYIAGRP